jgi:hypothetical protein
MRIYVFLKNKLISADAIVPFLLEAKSRDALLTCEFLVFHPATEAALRDNVVLWDAMALLGPVRLVTRYDRTVAGLVRHRVASALWIAAMLWRLAMGRARLIHFGQLAGSKLAFLLRAARDGELYVDAAFAGFTEMQTRFANLRRTRESKSDCMDIPRVLAFDPGSPALVDAQRRGARPFLAGPPHLMPAWTDYIARNADRFLERSHGPSVRGVRCISFMLGYMGPLDFMRAPDRLPQLFSESLDVLLDSCDDATILIKPHVITDMSIVKAVLQKKADPRLKITHLHPSVLASRSAFFIANYYSTTLSTASAIGCPTIEYTDYSDDALAASGGRSVRPDSVTYFIQSDRQRLQDIIRQLMIAGGSRTPHAAGSGINDQILDFFRAPRRSRGMECRH